MGKDKIYLIKMGKKWAKNLHIYFYKERYTDGQ